MYYYKSVLNNNLDLTKKEHKRLVDFVDACAKASSPIVSVHSNIVPFVLFVNLLQGHCVEIEDNELYMKVLLIAHTYDCFTSNLVCVDPQRIMDAMNIMGNSSMNIKDKIDKTELEKFQEFYQRFQNLFNLKVIQNIK